MTKPLAICLEDLDAASETERYLQCVALPEGEVGLGLDAEGNVLWQSAGGAFSIRVSADGRLSLKRAPGAPPAILKRDGRDLEVPGGADAPVLDQDELALPGKRFRIHVHGEAPGVSGPVAYRPPRPGPEPLVPVRDTPPAPLPDPVPIRVTPPAPPLPLRIVRDGGPVFWIVLLLVLGSAAFGIYWFFLR